MANLIEHVMLNKFTDELDEAITFVGGDTSKVSHFSEYPEVIKAQLVAGKIPTEYILEGDTSIIIADEYGRDQYNTQYAVGEKSGLIPGALYIRICTAIKDIEPIYVDCTPIKEVFFNDKELDDRIINTVKQHIDNDGILKDTIENILKESDLVNEETLRKLLPFKWGQSKIDSLEISNEGEIAFGKYNETSDETIFSIGGGRSNTERINLLEVEEDGDIWVLADTDNDGEKEKIKLQSELTRNCITNDEIDELFN